MCVRDSFEAHTLHMDTQTEAGEKVSVRFIGLLAHWFENVIHDNILFGMDEILSLIHILPRPAFPGRKPPPDSIAAAAQGHTVPCMSCLLYTSLTMRRQTKHLVSLGPDHIQALGADGPSGTQQSDDLGHLNSPLLDVYKRQARHRSR